MEYLCKPVETDEEKAGIRSVREAVFVEEQGIPAGLVHAGDAAGLLFEAAAFEANRVIGTARVKLTGKETAKIERMAVLKEYRRYGVGKGIVDFIIDEMRRRGMKTVELHAQESAIDFYRSCGFSETGPFFMEAGIRHRRMERTV